MEQLKFKKLYLYINISVILFVIIMDVSAFFLASKLQLYYVGITTRVIIGILCIFNGIWNACTDYYSILKDNRFNKNNKAPKWAWWLVFIIGVGCIITAFLGYGFNGVTKPE